jgi:hypothetical protein
MRTTIALDDRLLDALKRRAAERETTVSRLIEDSVRLVLAEPPAEPAPGRRFELVTFGKGGRFTGGGGETFSQLLEREDVERHGGRGR